MLRWLHWMASIVLLLAFSSSDRFAWASDGQHSGASATCDPSSCSFEAGSETSVGTTSGKPVVLATGGKGSAPACSMVPLSGVTTGDDGSKGFLYDESCGRGDNEGMFGGEALPMWQPVGPGGMVVPAVDPRVAAQQAYTQLKPPVPVVAMSPSMFQVVGVPTWLWIDSAAWRPQSATVTVPGVTVTATATPVNVTWHLGDGDGTVVCRGPGTVFTDRSDPAAASPDCGYTYQRPSTGLHGAGAFTVTASMHWRVVWQARGTGQQGDLPDLVTHATSQVRVREVQTLVVAGNGE